MPGFRPTIRGSADVSFDSACLKSTLIQSPAPGRTSVPVSTAATAYRPAVIAGHPAPQRVDGGVDDPGLDGMAGVIEGAHVETRRRGPALQGPR